MMNETDYHNACDGLFSQMEALLDGAGVDYDSNGRVIEAELENGGKIIINRQSAAREVWIAAPGGGYHFARRNRQWLNTRDERDIMVVLAALIA